MNRDHGLEVPLIDRQRDARPTDNRSPFSQFLSSASPPHKYQVNYSMAKYLSFLDMIPFIKKINQATNATKVDDLPLPYHNFNIEAKVMTLDAEWNKEREKANPNLVWALYRTYKNAFFAAGVIMLFTFVGRLLSTLMLGKIIDVITRKDLGLEFDADILVGRTVLFAIIFCATNIINTHFWNHNIILAARVRLTITGLVYKKMQTIALSSLQEMNIGKVVNLLASDLNDIDSGFMHIWPVILSPFLIFLTAYFLWDYFGFYTIVSISGLIGSIFLSQYVSKLTQAPRVAKNAVTDERIKLTNEIVDCIRLLKMYSWEKAFKGIVEALRQKEFLALLKLNKIEILGRIVADMSVGVCAFVMFAFYTIQGGLLTPEKVYTSLMLLNFARLWCIMFPHQGRVFIVNAKVMKKRVEDILTIPDVVTNQEAENIASRKNSGYGMVMSQNQIQLYEKDETSKIKPIQLRDFTAYWSKKIEKPCLRNLNVSIRPGQITTVIGKIGSGKTSFLLSLLREIPLTTGQLFCEGRIAYVEQEPIIFSQTVKENILFGQEYDAELYQKVIRACNLHIDLKQLQDGENTVVGERGVTLSGGQKARVSLARALYSNSDIYLFDDPLSAVDSKVARHLWSYAIKSELLRDKIVILVTHHLTYAKEADHVIAFDEGRIEAEGTFKDLQTMNIDLLNIFTHENEEYGEDEAEKRKTTRRSTTVEVQQKEPAKEEKPKKFGEGTTLVNLQTYRDYLKATGNFRLWYTVVGLFVTAQIISILNTRFTGYWAYDQQTYFLENNESLDGFQNSWYLFWGFVLVTAQFALTYYKSVFLFTFAVNNNSVLHNQILTRITRSAVSFFDKTPIGTILNRFSSDLGILDKSIWFSASFLIESFLQILFGLATICTINFLVIIPSAIVMYLLVKVRDIFQKTSLESKRLDLTTKSPIYSQISATINGLLVIRVFQQGGRFLQNFMETIYINSRCFIFQQRIQRLFGMIQDMLAYVLTVCGIFLYIHVATTSDIDPGLFGLAIVLILDICNRSAPFIRLTLEMDLQMQSAQRVLDYTRLPEEAPEHKYGMDEHVQRQFSNQWPHRGEIVFNNVYMKYEQTFDHVLRGLNFVVKPGMKVGCVGRTGAGKSSLIQVLFRMVEIDDGAETGGYIKIDGVDIKEIGLEMLRKNLSIIPQTAAIFTGNIRRNLDPFGQFSDTAIWKALEEVKLKSYVERLEKQLDTDMTVSSTIFSAGQKQLICLARAMLRKSKIIVLDEATANVDIETDNFIQEKIDEVFADSTVFTVAHRLTTIAHYDKILVLDKGQVAEYEAPYLLLVNNEGDKRITNTEGIFAKMVTSAGESMSRRIFDIAYKKYFETNQPNLL